MYWGCRQVILDVLRQVEALAEHIAYVEAALGTGCADEVDSGRARGCSAICGASFVQVLATRHKPNRVFGSEAD